jgi:hypothetical protein
MAELDARPTQRSRRAHERSAQAGVEAQPQVPPPFTEGVVIAPSVTPQW